MRATPLLLLCFSVALHDARAQTAAVGGQVVLRESGQPLAYATVSVPSHGTQRLATDSGTFVLRGLPPGEVRIRFTRIGYLPKDTAVRLAAGETLRIRTVTVGGYRDRDGAVVGAADVDTVVRGPLPAEPYAPRGVIRRRDGRDHVTLPELPDIADTAFTNHHCFWYAGLEPFGSDSAIRVDFEPVPWLAKGVDLEGSIYLRADGYQLVGMVTRLNRIPPRNRRVQGYSVRATFREIVSGVPVLEGWALTNTFRNGGPPFVQTGTVTDVRWLDASEAAGDSARPESIEPQRPAR